MTIAILNMDCMEYMAALPDKSFDLAIVDPPYGINYAQIAGNLMELDTDYYNVALERFNNHKAQARLFIPETIRDTYEQVDFLYARDNEN